METPAPNTHHSHMVCSAGLEAHLGGLPQHTGSASKRELQDRAYTHSSDKSCPDSLSRASDTSDSRLVRAYNRKPCCHPQPDNMGKPSAQT
ncbi:unnamed protein product [Boreogadus saida]